MDSMLPAFLLLLPAVPMVLVYLVGIIFSTAKLGAYHRAAMLGLTGFGALLIGQLVRASGTLLTLPQNRGTMTVAELGARLGSINLVGTMLALAGTILVMLAIFADRNQKSQGI